MARIRSAPAPIPVAQSADWSVIGNQDARSALQRALRAGHAAHAYVFAGSPDLGKRQIARAFTQALLCEAPVDGGAIGCGECRSCRKVERGTHPDVDRWDLERQAAAAQSSSRSTGKNTTITIETARELRASTALRPIEGRRRVVVVEDAGTMQETAQEALLKTLEEPPAAVVLILITDDAELLLPTIRSRCTVVEFRPVPPATIAAELINRGASAAEAAEISSLAEGRPGLALRALSTPELLNERRDSRQRALAWAFGTRYDHLVTAAWMGDQFSAKRDAVFADVESVLSVWRDVVLLTAGARPLVAAGSPAEALDRAAADVSIVDALAALKATQQCLADLEANVRPRLALEGMVVQWPIRSNSR